MATRLGFEPKLVFPRKLNRLVPSTTRPSGIKFMIILCKIHGNVKHYQSNKRVICSKCSIIRVSRRRKELKIKSIEYLGNKCKDCNLKDTCPDIYDFHHVDPSKKDFNISRNGHIKSWDNLKIELDKCILLCANCHRRRHANTNTFPEKRQKIIPNVCSCGTNISRRAKKCKKCSSKISWPDIDYLKQRSLDIGFSALGRELGVSDNAIRKHIRSEI